MMEILLAIVVLLLAGVVILQWKGVMQNHVESLRSDMRASLQNFSETLNGQLTAMTSQMRSDRRRR